MAERIRCRQMSDRELEDYLSGLPRREPKASLRERLLSSTYRPSRPAYSPFTGALAALAILLLLADVAALRQQDAPASADPDMPAAALVLPASEQSLAEADFGEVPLSAIPRPAKKAQIARLGESAAGMKSRFNAEDDSLSEYMGDSP